VTLKAFASLITITRVSRLRDAVLAPRRLHGLQLRRQLLADQRQLPALYRTEWVVVYTHALLRCALSDRSCACRHVAQRIAGVDDVHAHSVRRPQLRPVFWSVHGKARCLSCLQPCSPFDRAKRGTVRPVCQRLLTFVLPCVFCLLLFSAPSLDVSVSHISMPHTEQGSISCFSNDPEAAFVQGDATACARLCPSNLRPSFFADGNGTIVFCPDVALMVVGPLRPCSTWSAFETGIFWNDSGQPVVASKRALLVCGPTVFNVTATSITRRNEDMFVGVEADLTIFSREGVEICIS
jgi:hypothetical protein